MTEIATRVFDYLGENNLETDSSIVLRNYVGTKAASKIKFITQFVIDIVPENANAPGSLHRYETDIYRELKHFPNVHTAAWGFSGNIDELRQILKELFEHFGIKENVEETLDESGVKDSNNNSCSIALTSFRVYHL